MSELPKTAKLLELALCNVVRINEAIESGDLRGASTTAYQTEDVLTELREELRAA